MPDLQLEDNAEHVPALRARIEIQFLLAESVHVHRGALLTAARVADVNWIHYVQALAASFAEQIPHAERREDALLVLDHFDTKASIKRAPPRTRDVLHLIRGHAQHRLASETSPLVYLGAANERAHAAIATLLQRRGIASDVAERPARVRLATAAGRGAACATSAKLLDRITWTCDWTPVSFWAAVQACAVLQHEYLSHIAPRHPGLSADVREGWLMDVLIHEVRHRGDPEDLFDTGALGFLRDQLTGTPEAHEYVPYSTPGSRDLPMLVRMANPSVYWAITGVMLSLGERDVTAERVDEMLRALARFRPDDLRLLLLHFRWTGLESFTAELRRRLGNFP